MKPGLWGDELIRGDRGSAVEGAMMRTTLAVLAVVIGCDGTARFGDSGTMVDESFTAPELECLDPRNPLVGDEPAWSAADDDGGAADEDGARRAQGDSTQRLLDGRCGRWRRHRQPRVDDVAICRVNEEVAEESARGGRL